MMIASTASACSERRIFGIERVLLGGVRHHAEMCAFYVRPGVNKISISGGEVNDFGGGIISQDFSAGSSCSGGDVTTALVNCEDGQVHLVSSSDSGFEVQISDDGYTYSSQVSLLYRRAVDAGLEMRPEELLRFAADYSGLKSNELATTAETFKIEGRRINLSCGCQLFYPDSLGATQ